MTDKEKEIQLFREKQFGHRIRKTYPDRVPIIVFLSENNSFKLNKYKYLCPDELTIGRFIYELRKHIYYPDQNVKIEEKSYYILCKNTLVNNTLLILEVYNNFKDPKSGCLFFEITEESTFGKNVVNQHLDEKLIKKCI